MDVRTAPPSPWTEDHVDPATGGPALARPELRPAAVHLWAVATHDWTDDPDLLLGVLTPAERLRAGSFAFARHRRQYVISHAFLRCVLSWYLARPPHQIRLTAGPHGKPRIATPPDRPVLEFNLSHCAALTIVGVAQHAIGVDVEEVRADADDMKIAAAFFHPREREQLEALPADRRRRAFYCGWTRKEAVAKATGAGLSVGLDAFAVEPAGDEPPPVPAPALDTGVLRWWHLVHLEPLAGVVGALAVPFRPTALHAARLAGPLLPAGRRVGAEPVR